MAGAASAAARNPICGICDKVLPNYNTLRLNCGHQYHQACLQPLLNRHLSMCPLDAKRITHINGTWIAPFVAFDENENSKEAELIGWTQSALQDRPFMDEPFYESRNHLFEQADEGLDRLEGRVEMLLSENPLEADFAPSGFSAMGEPVDETSLDLLRQLAQGIFIFRDLVEKMEDVDTQRTGFIRCNALEQNLAALEQRAIKKQIHIDETFIKEGLILLKQLEKATLLLEEYERTSKYLNSRAGTSRASTIGVLGTPSFLKESRPLHERNISVIRCPSIYSGDSVERTAAKVDALVVARPIPLKIFSSLGNKR